MSWICLGLFLHLRSSFGLILILTQYESLILGLVLSKSCISLVLVLSCSDLGHFSVLARLGLVSVSKYYLGIVSVLSFKSCHSLVLVLSCPHLGISIVSVFSWSHLTSNSCLGRTLISVSKS
jgi:hypothetical protein